ncbi:hypothetical protein [Streptomyces sp. NPDC006645]|uniref:hypothetical protein n=1 Tax=Streptomyces sp. NPDC006645 TaxID=3157184 RepID=UPI0033A12A56
MTTTSLSWPDGDPLVLLDLSREMIAVHTGTGDLDPGWKFWHTAATSSSWLSATQPPPRRAQPR